MSLYKIWVISLKSATSRRESIANQMKALGLEYQIFDANDPSSICPEITKLQQQHSNSNVPGEWACYSSHFSLWQLCVTTNEPIIILEDDIILNTSIVSIYRQLPEIFESINYIRLGGTFLRKYHEIRPINDKQKIVTFHRPPSGAMAYTLTPVAAKKFIRHICELIVPVDDYMDAYWINGNPCYSVYPYCIDSCQGPSNISRNSENKHEKRPLTTKIKKEISRLYVQLVRSTAFVRNHGIMVLAKSSGWAKRIKF